MKRTSLLAALLLVALICSCQTQSDTKVSTTTPYRSSQLSSFPQQSKAPTQTDDTKPSSDAVVISTKANLRESPNTSALVSVELEKGALLSVLEEKPTGAWYKVRHVPSGKTGWIHGNTIKLTSAGASPVPEQSASGSGSLTPATPKQERGSTSGTRGDTYINSFGEEVPRPRRNNSIPDGASARCRDGTYSFSRNRRGTCSHHGGVAQWL